MHVVLACAQMLLFPAVQYIEQVSYSVSVPHYWEEMALCMLFDV